MKSDDKASFLKNVDFDLSKKVTRINLNSMLYPRTVVMRAAYSFTDSFDVAVEGDDSSSIVFIRDNGNDKLTQADFEDIAYRFYSELIHASVEETQARRYADTRNALIGAALKSLFPITGSLNIPKDTKSPPIKEPKLKNNIKPTTKNCK